MVHRLALKTSVDVVGDGNIVSITGMTMSKGLPLSYSFSSCFRESG